MDAENRIEGYMTLLTYCFYRYFGGEGGVRTLVVFFVFNRL